MGTNYYILKEDGTHVGKKSAAGLYCWNCSVTLCKGGDRGIHCSSNEWYEKCPKCGKIPSEESLESSSAGRELGFNKLEYKKKTEVASCSSFTWAINPEEIRKVRKIKDEYGKKYSKKEFEQMLLECPIQYFDSIGREFC